jgi:hypothetical protein
VTVKWIGELKLSYIHLLWTDRDKTKLGSKLLNSSMKFPKKAQVMFHMCLITLQLFKVQRTWGKVDYLNKFLLNSALDTSFRKTTIRVRDALSKAWSMKVLLAISTVSYKLSFLLELLEMPFTRCHQFREEIMSFVVYHFVCREYFIIFS